MKNMLTPRQYKIVQFVILVSDFSRNLYFLNCCLCWYAGIWP